MCNYAWKVQVEEIGQLILYYFSKEDCSEEEAASGGVSWDVHQKGRRCSTSLLEMSNFLEDLESVKEEVRRDCEHMPLRFFL
jgi:hypothetical protein